MDLETLLKNLSNKSVQILDGNIRVDEYTPIDLSSDNSELSTIAIHEPVACQSYIDKILEKNNAKIAYGGYLEKRNLYEASRFSEDAKRDIHLGMDFWCSEGTNVLTPIGGEIHSFKNNSDCGNYGPTIILEHEIANSIFYTLYGHLSLESLEGLYIGKHFEKGEILAQLGTTEINVNYAPHLHFQIIKNIGDFNGDYPGVCSKEDIGFYKNNCPDPNLFFKL